MLALNRGVSPRVELPDRAYACELVHRSRGEPHGTAVHILWRQMDEPTRKQISPDRIWQAREQVADALIASIRQRQRIDAVGHKEHSR